MMRTRVAGDVERLIANLREEFVKQLAKELPFESNRDIAQIAFDNACIAALIHERRTRHEPRV